MEDTSVFMEDTVIILLLLLLLFASAGPAPVVPADKREVLRYLTRFGYLRTPASPLSYLAREDGLAEAVTRMQRFGGVTETGEVDAETAELLRTPRCGLPDLAAARRKRYALQGSRWKKRVLSYTVGKYPTSLAKLEVDADVRKAFNMWAAASGLTFMRAENRTEAGVDIEIRFEDAEHGDEDSFDGPGGKDESISFISDSIIQYSIQF